MSQFFVIDGTDGSGKGTQVSLLEKRLKDAGHDVLVVDFPQYGNKSAALVEEYLNGAFGSASEVTPYQASVFYAADRFAAKGNMQKHLDSGGIILSNRYVSGNQIHQSGKIKDRSELDRFLTWLDHFEYELMNIPRPDHVFFLDVPPWISDTLVEGKESRSYIENGKTKDIHEADPQHIQDAYDRAKELVKRYDEWESVSCVRDSHMRTREDIRDELYQKITDYIGR